MDNIFIHDATPTWSGFIYQGYIAIYLALNKICELKSKGLGIEEIGLNYKIEVENCEDIAIVKIDGKDKQYLSIHQVKNQKDNNISAYRSPLVQLMMEKGFCAKGNLGTPEAYLHVSKKINENSTEIDQKLVEWKTSIAEYNNDIANLIKRIGIEDNKEAILKEMSNKIKNEPIKLNRSEHTKMLKSIEAACSNKSCDIAELVMQAENLIDFLDKKLGVTCIDEKVQVYQYEDKKTYCSGTDVFGKTVEQVKKYKNNDSAITYGQYEFIADKLLHYMREHIIKRHQIMQSGGAFEKSFPFYDIINILDDSLSEYETEANVLALRRLYDDHLSQYCRLICKNRCLDSAVSECKLQQVEYRKNDLEKNDFIKMCYGFNPECDKKIKNRECLNVLLNKDGLNESVFEIIEKVPKDFFIKDDNNKTKLVLNNKKRNAFLTAISSKNSDEVVNGIVKGIDNNSELISPIFEADQLITTRLKTDESVWNNNYSEIQEKYISSEAKKNDDNNQNSICTPKRPGFVKAEDIINEFSKY